MDSMQSTGATIRKSTISHRSHLVGWPEVRRTGPRLMEEGMLLVMEEGEEQEGTRQLEEASGEEKEAGVKEEGTSIGATEEEGTTVVADDTTTMKDITTRRRRRGQAEDGSTDICLKNQLEILSFS